MTADTQTLSSTQRVWALLYAIDQGPWARVRALLDNKDSENQHVDVNAYFGLPLRLSVCLLAQEQDPVVFSERLEMAHLLVAAGADVNLCYSSDDRHSLYARQIIQDMQQCGVEEPWAEKMTQMMCFRFPATPALSLATDGNKGVVELVEFLLSHGADVGAEDHMAMRAAVAFGSQHAKDIVRVLLLNGGLADTLNSENLQNACINDDQDMFDLLYPHSDPQKALDELQERGYGHKTLMLQQRMLSEQHKKALCGALGHDNTPSTSLGRRM